MSLTSILFAQSTILIAMGAWAYVGSDSPSMTALIPVFIGAVIMALSFKVENSKVIVYVLIVISLLTLVAMTMPLRGALSRDDIMAIGRVSTMLLATIIALIYLFISVKSYK